MSCPFPVPPCSCEQLRRLSRGFVPLFEGVMGHGSKEWFVLFLSGARRFFQVTDVSSTISNDFGRVWNYLADSNPNFDVVDIFF